MPSTSIRIDEQSLAVLRELARKERQPMQAVLRQAIESYRRQKFLEQAEEQRERELRDQALEDGLERK